MNKLLMILPLLATSAFAMDPDPGDTEPTALTTSARVLELKLKIAEERQEQERIRREEEEEEVRRLTAELEESQRETQELKQKAESSPLEQQVQRLEKNVVNEGGKALKGAKKMSKKAFKKKKKH